MEFGTNNEYKPKCPVGIGWNGREQLWVPICPQCGYIHAHGVEPELKEGDITHRLAHCGDHIVRGKLITRPNHYSGYYILIKGVLTDEEEAMLLKHHQNGKKFSGSLGDGIGKEKGIEIKI